MTRQDSLTLREILVPAIKKAGGWVNVHTHADKAFTLNQEMLDIRKNCTLQENWTACAENPPKRISTRASAVSLNT